MLDVDTFLTTLYVLVDEIDKRDMLDQDQPPQEALDRWTPHLPGPAPALSRSEVVTLAIFGQWAQFGSERAFYRYADSIAMPSATCDPPSRRCPRAASITGCCGTARRCWYGWGNKWRPG